MIISRLKVGAKNIDDIRITIGGDQPTIISLKGQRSALNLWSAIAKGYMADYEGPLTVNIDGIDHRFPEPVWEAIFSVVDQWFEEYLPTEYAELHSIILDDEPPESAEIIPLYS